jgi:hypothetical protein
MHLAKSPLAPAQTLAYRVEISGICETEAAAAEPGQGIATKSIMAPGARRVTR